MTQDTLTVLRAAQIALEHALPWIDGLSCEAEVSDSAEALRTLIAAMEAAEPLPFVLGKNAVINC